VPSPRQADGALPQLVRNIDSLLTSCAQVPAQIRVERRCRGADPRHRRRRRDTRRRRPVRRQVTALWLHAVPPPEGAGEICARRDVAITAGYASVVRNGKQQPLTLHSPRRRPLHHRHRAICTARLCTEHFYARRAKRCRPHCRLHTAHRCTL
jgi:hypothetical protein